ncbi:MAG: hypothetical protein Q7T20_00905 [Saprospiraceae bacterium]|nr:hypothetical protein [Saprospiraceae bacterium]
MKRPHLCFAIAGLCFGASPKGAGQPVVRDTAANKAEAGTCHCRKAADSTATDCATTQVVTRPKLLHNLRVSGGQLTIPFKIRPKAEHGTFRLTTDVTLGAFVGLTKKLSEKKEHYLTIPITAGLTFININDRNTSQEFADSEDGETDIVPGLSWSSGILLQLDQYNLGLIFGKDYASEVGEQWLYHRKMWWSFGLGFSFTN